MDRRGLRGSERRADADGRGGGYLAQWSYGDVDAGFKEAALVLDETFSTAANANLPLESRSTMAYWENGKLYLHGSTQSTAQTVPAVARWVGIEPSEVVILSEYTGGGFGSKVTGRSRWRFRRCSRRKPTRR